MSSAGWNPTQQRILEAARALIEAEGAASVRLEDVARRVGLSRQAVYLHFGSRAGLLIQLGAYIDAKADARARVGAFLDAAQDPAGVLDAYLDWWLDHLPRIRGVADALLAERARDADAEAAWRDRMDALHGVTRAVVDRLADAALLAPHWKRTEAADWLWSLSSVQLYEAMRGRRWSHRRYGDRLRTVVRAALLDGV